MSLLTILSWKYPYFNHYFFLQFNLLFPLLIWIFLLILLYLKINLLYFDYFVRKSILIFSYLQMIHLIPPLHHFIICLNQIADFNSVLIFNFTIIHLLNSIIINFFNLSFFITIINLHLIYFILLSMIIFSYLFLPCLRIIFHLFYLFLSKYLHEEAWNLVQARILLNSTPEYFQNFHLKLLSQHG